MVLLDALPDPELIAVSAKSGAPEEPVIRKLPRVSTFARRTQDQFVLTTFDAWTLTQLVLPPAQAGLAVAQTVALL